MVHIKREIFKKKKQLFKWICYISSESKVLKNNQAL